MGGKDGKSKTSEEVRRSGDKEFVGDITESAFSAVICVKAGKN